MLDRPYLINHLVGVSDELEAIKHVDGLAGLFGNDPQVGFPHVAAYEFQLPTSLGRTFIISE